MVSLPADDDRRLAAIGGALLVASSFLPWATVEAVGTSTTANGLTGIGYLTPVTGVIVLYVVSTREWTGFDTTLTTAAGALTLGSLALIYTSLEHVFAVGYPSGQLSVSAEPGLPLAMLAALLVTVGGYRGLRRIRGTGSPEVAP